MRHSPSVLLLAATCSCLGMIRHLGAEEANWSELRERWNSVESPYLDLRRSVAGVNPGAAVRARGFEVTLRGYTVDRSYDAQSRVLRTTTDTSDRQGTVALQLRQCLVLGPVGWEARGGWSGSRATGDHGDPIDPLVGLNWSLIEERRTGLTVFGGATFPVGATTNWIENHGGVGARAEVRVAQALGMAAFSLNAGGSWVPAGSNEDGRGGFVIPTTPPQAGTTWDTSFIQGDVKFLATYRLSRWIRFGGIQEATLYRWKGTAPYLELDSRSMSAPTSAVVEVSAPYGFHFSALVGRDFLTSPPAPGVRGEVGIVKTFY